MVDLPHRQPVLGYARNLDSSGSLWVAETIRAGSGDHPAHELMKVWIDLDLCSRDGCSARRTRRARLRGGAVRRRASGRGTLSDGAYESFRVRPRCPDWEVDDADSLSGEDAPKEETNVVSRSRIKSVTGVARSAGSMQCSGPVGLPVWVSKTSSGPSTCTFITTTLLTKMEHGALFRLCPKRSGESLPGGQPGPV